MDIQSDYIPIILWFHDSILQIKALEAELEEMRAQKENIDVLYEAMKTDYVALTERCDAMESSEQNVESTNAEMSGLQDEFRVIYKAKKKAESERDQLRERVQELELQQIAREHNGLKESVCSGTNSMSLSLDTNTADIGTQTDFAFLVDDAHLRALSADNEYLMKELDFAIADRSRFHDCIGEHDYHKGDISSIEVSPINYCSVLIL